MSKNIVQMFVDEIAGYLKRIADLEKQLAEKKEQLKIALEDFNETQEANDKLASQLADLQYEIPMENARLKQELAEKEKEETERMMKFEKECQEYYKSKDFAIEQLEKVRNEIDKADKSYFKGMEEWSNDKRNYFDLGFSDCQSCIWDVVDWQIQELKGGK